MAATSVKGQKGRIDYTKNVRTFSMLLRGSRWMTIHNDTLNINFNIHFSRHCTALSSLAIIRHCAHKNSRWILWRYYAPCPSHLRFTAYMLRLKGTIRGGGRGRKSCIRTWKKRASRIHHVHGWISVRGRDPCPFPSPFPPPKLYMAFDETFVHKTPKPTILTEWSMHSMTYTHKIVRILM